MNLNSTLTIPLFLAAATGACRSTQPYPVTANVDQDATELGLNEYCQAASHTPDSPPCPYCVCANTHPSCKRLPEYDGSPKPRASLGSTGRSLSDLAPLKYASTLESIDISNNHVSDLAPLRDLSSLKRLYVSRNSLRSLPMSHKWTQLTELNIAANRITDISAVVTMKSLESLDLSMNRIRSAVPLEKTTALRALYADDNEISDVSPLAGSMRLERLQMAQNALLDLRPLADLSSLRQVGYLDLRDNPIGRCGCPVNGESEAITTFCQNTFVDRN